MVNIDSKVKNIIEHNPVAFATADNLGNPNVIGVAFVKVVDKNKVIVTNNFMSHTIENITKNPNVCLAIWNSDWEGYKLVGTAEYFETGELAEYVKKMPENEGLPAKGAVVITINKLIQLH